MRFGLCLLATLLLCPGCSAWPATENRLAELRDDRAVDIEGRLTHRPTPVSNPFGTPLEEPTDD